MGSINRVIIMGIIGSDPELKFARNGKPFVRLSIATHKRVKDPDGNTKRETQWHKVMLWGKNAEACSTFCQKGAPLYIEGHLAPYTKDEAGNVSHHISIVADQMHFIPGSKMARSSEHGEFGSLELPPAYGENENPTNMAVSSTATLN
jgi:single-strand DNA-binding protein